MRKEEDGKLLEFLESELRALESGNRMSQQQPWRARLVFEDSPCCPNHDKKGARVPCEECVLMKLVPKDRRHEKIPCRFIPLNASGDTLDSLYRCGTQEEMEAALGEWLRKTIRQVQEGTGHSKAARS